MGAGQGLRAKTRDLFSRGFRQKGVIPPSVYLRTLKIGDYVDIKVNSSIHKGFPYKYYQGKTGVVWNVTKRAVGVEVNKIVRGIQLKKRFHVRIEHIQPSRCREAFLKRRAENDAKRAEAKKKGEPVPFMKRQPAGPRDGFEVSGALGDRHRHPLRHREGGREEGEVDRPAEGKPGGSDHAGLLSLALVLLCQGLGLGGGVGWEPGALAGATLIMNAKGRAGAFSSSTPARSPLPSESSWRESRVLAAGWWWWRPRESTL